jgi:hypothetical protein
LLLCYILFKNVLNITFSWCSKSKVTRAFVNNKSLVFFVSFELFLKIFTSKKSEKMAAMIQNALSGEKISQILNSDGPTVSCVYIPGETGIAVEIQLDMTPKVAAPAKQLGGSPTFAGTINSLDVVIMCLREPDMGTKPNQHVLPAPMDTAEIPGPILMIRMDENSEPQHFTLNEYNAYKAATPASSSTSSSSSSTKTEVVEAVPEEEEDDEEDDDEEEADDFLDEEGGEEDDYMEHVVKRIAEIFKTKTGRDPTAEEVQALLEQMSGVPGEEDDEEEDDEEEEEETNEADALESMSPEEMVQLLRSKLAESFVQSQGRAPTEDEIDQLLQRMSEDTEFQDELLMAGQEQTAADNASAMKTPAPDKKRKMEDDIEGEPAAKKTSPASVTETAAVEGQ